MSETVFYKKTFDFITYEFQIWKKVADKDLSLIDWEQGKRKLQKFKAIRWHIFIFWWTEKSLPSWETFSKNKNFSQLKFYVQCVLASVLQLYHGRDRKWSFKEFLYRKLRRMQYSLTSLWQNWEISNEKFEKLSSFEKDNRQ